LWPLVKYGNRDYMVSNHSEVEKSTFAFQMDKQALEYYIRTSLRGTDAKHRKNATNYDTGFTFLVENYKIADVPIYVMKFSPVFEPLEKFILDCHAHGICSHLYQNYMFPKVTPDNPAKPLTMEMLSAGYFLSILFVIVSVIVFILELVVFYGQKYLKQRKTQKTKRATIVD
jgi:hypothetical protein